MINTYACTYRLYRQFIYSFLTLFTVFQLLLLNFLKVKHANKVINYNYIVNNKFQKSKAK